MKEKFIKWFKRIKNEGFTLIELLAVIVILAIILVIVVPKIFDTIDSSKTKSLASSAKNLASSWEKEIVSSQLNSTPSKLGELTDEFRCITSDEADALDVSMKDYRINTSLNDNVEPCSMVKKDSSGKVIVVLYAHPQGSVFTSKSAIEGNMFASSGGENSEKAKVEYKEVLVNAKDSVNEIETNMVMSSIKEELTTEWTPITISQAESLGLSTEKYEFYLSDAAQEMLSYLQNESSRVRFIAINRASDDAAGLSISEKMRAKIIPTVSSIRLYNDNVQMVLISKEVTSLGRLYVFNTGETGYIDTIRDVDMAEENITSAESRIRDTDM